MVAYVSEKPQIAVVGTFQVGKSSMMNCLLADSCADIGKGIPTTHTVSTWRFSDAPQQLVSLYETGSSSPVSMTLDGYLIHDHATSSVFPKLERMEFHLNRDCLRQVDILDTPGLDASGPNGERDAALAYEAIDRADFCLLVVTNLGLSTFDRCLAQRIARNRKPFAVVMNCWDSADWDPSGQVNQRVAREEIPGQLREMNATPISVEAGCPVWACNVAWCWVAEMTKIPPDKLPQRHSKRLEELRRSVTRHFREQERELPATEELRRLSNFLPVQEFLCGTGLRVRTAPTIARLNNAAEAWRQDLLKKVEDAKSAISANR